MTGKSRWRTGAALGACASFLAALGVTTGMVAAPAQAVAPAITVTPNPWYTSDPFEGWGTSLVWMANATGGYPDELREELYELVFGDEGLRLNLARYNVGGGHASDVTDYLRPGGAVDGYWAADQTGDLYGAPTTVGERQAILDAWDPDNPEHYDFSADETQRWWVERLADDERITHWEVFANSAPYFMTENGYVSGGFDANEEQLRVDAMDSFAGYLTRVSEFLEDTYDIDVATIDPFNEPNTDYWSTSLSSGEPVGGRQEGMHVGPERQKQMIAALAERLDAPETTTDAVISAMDETNPGRFVTNWRGYTETSKQSVTQLNVHTYGTGSRRIARDIAQGADKPLWMSEVGGSWTSGFDPVTMANGLGMAERIQSDLRELEPNAWVLWQPIEDLYNMEGTGEDLNWGSIFVDFDCSRGPDGVWRSERRVADAGRDLDAVPACDIQVNSKFATIQNFTHFISPGDHLIATDNTEATAAIDDSGRTLTLVYRNPANQARDVAVDLSKFAGSDGATVTTYTTTEGTREDPAAHALVPGTAADAAGDQALVEVPGRSVTTVVIDGVNGVAEHAAPVADGESYQLVGEQSGKALTASDDPATVIEPPATTAEQVDDQLWTVHEAPAAERSGTRSYVLATDDGRVLGATSAGTDLRAQSIDEAAEADETRWILTTENGRTWQFVNSALAQVLEVGGQSTANGSGVGTWDASGGAHQRWQVRDTHATGAHEVVRSTTAGVAPSLPEHVIPTYSWGAGEPAPVSWDDPGEGVWQSPGEVIVTGTATDVFGNELKAHARVVVGGYTMTDPVSLTVRQGVTPTAVEKAAPAEVPARVGASELTFPASVNWDFSGIDSASLEQVGVLTVPGIARSNDGSDLAASLSIIVTAPVAVNIAAEESTEAEATFTEPGYDIDSTRNRVLDDKGWSNWKSGEKNPSDTLTYTFAEPESLDSAGLYFFRDGDYKSWPQTVTLEYRDADGDWAAVPGHEQGEPVREPEEGAAPVIEVDLEGVEDATGLRAVLEAWPQTHMIVSEVEIYAQRAGLGSTADLAALRVDGASVEGFDADTTSYEAPVAGSRLPVITAFPVDEAADVQISRPSDEDPTARIAVTSADGENTRTYEVTIARQVALADVQVLGSVVEGEQVRAFVTADPKQAQLTYGWFIDGDPVGARTGAEFTIPAGTAGSELTVVVTGAAEGFASVSVQSDAVEIAAGAEEPGDGDDADGDATGGHSDSGDSADADIPGAADAADGGGGHGKGSLPETGSDALSWVVLAGLLTVGGVVVLRTRRVLPCHQIRFETRRKN